MFSDFDVISGKPSVVAESSNRNSDVMKVVHGQAATVETSVQEAVRVVTSLESIMGKNQDAVTKNQGEFTKIRAKGINCSKVSNSGAIITDKDGNELRGRGLAADMVFGGEKALICDDGPDME